MNLLVSTNRKYLSRTETMVYSLSRFLSEPLSVWCLYDELPTQQRARFSHHLLAKCHASHVGFIHMGLVRQSENLFPLNTQHLSRESYFRLFPQFYLPEDVDRILWLDSDIIVNGPLHDLYNATLKDASLVAFSDMDPLADNDKHLRRLGLSLTKPYFNAGVLLLNLDYLRNNTSLYTILDCCKKNRFRLKFEDQDVMNLLYHDSAVVLKDQRFNCMVNAPLAFSSPDIAERAVIIHYAGRKKPWTVQRQNEFSHYWWVVRRAEGLRFGDRSVIALGWLWKKLNGPRWKRLLLAPYLRLADRRARKARKP